MKSGGQRRGKTVIPSQFPRAHAALLGSFPPPLGKTISNTFLTKACVDFACRGVMRWEVAMTRPLTETATYHHLGFCSCIRSTAKEGRDAGVRRSDAPDAGVTGNAVEGIDPTASVAPSELPAGHVGPARGGREAVATRHRQGIRGTGRSRRRPSAVNHCSPHSTGTESPGSW